MGSFSSLRNSQLESICQRLAFAVNVILSINAEGES